MPSLFFVFGIAAFRVPTGERTSEPTACSFMKVSHTDEHPIRSTQAGSNRGFAGWIAMAGVAASLTLASGLRGAGDTPGCSFSLLWDMDSARGCWRSDGICVPSWYLGGLDKRGVGPGHKGILMWRRFAGGSGRAQKCEG